MKHRFILISLCTMLLAGCVQLPNTALNSASESRISGGDLVNIALSADIPGRRETSENIMGGTFEKNRYETGKVWERVFIGRAGVAPARLEIMSTKMDETMGAAGFTVHMTYDVEARLFVGGESYPIRAHGARTSGGKFEGARQEAVELAVVDAARQSSAILVALKK